MLKENIFQVFKEYKESNSEGISEDVDAIKIFLEEVFELTYQDNRSTIDSTLFSTMYNKWYRKNHMKNELG